MVLFLFLAVTGIFVYICHQRINQPNAQIKLSIKRSQSAMPARFSPIIHSSPISKDLIVHSVYFDNRARNGHDNTSVFLIVANRTIFDSNWIVGCGVGNVKALEFIAHFTGEGIAMHRYLGERAFPYEEFFVECYDLPVVNGSQGFVMYKTAKNSPVYVTESEHPLFIPAPRVQPSGEYNFTVVTCTKVHDKGATWLPEFIQYQRTIGVDHVHVNFLDTFIRDGGLKAHLAHPYLAQAIIEGFVSFTVWTEWYNVHEIYLHSEILRKLDCVYRFRGTYDYAFPIDTDDFFTPQIPGKTNLKDYILKWCYGSFIGSCEFVWIMYFPGACGLVDNGFPDDGNVTKKLRSYVSWDHQNWKTLHLTSAIIDATFHGARCEWCLMPGYKIVTVPFPMAYIAHMRMHSNPSNFLGFIECKLSYYLQI